MTTITRFIVATAYIVAAMLAVIALSWLVVAEVRYFFSGVIKPMDAETHRIVMLERGEIK